MNQLEQKEGWVTRFDKSFGYKENGDAYFTVDYIENGVKQFIQSEIDRAVQARTEEVESEIEEFAVHNAKTIHHNNGYREYLDVRDLLQFITTLKDTKISKDNI